MSRSQREKGKAGEREAAAMLRKLTQIDVQRRVRQHDGDSDLVGLEPWVVEVKRNESMSVEAMWLQAVVQADSVGGVPLLLYRRSRQPWRAVWSADGEARNPVESSPEVWWRVTGQEAMTLLDAMPSPRLRQNVSQLVDRDA